MARFLLLWLILADTCVVLAMAHEKSQYPSTLVYFSNQPAPSPSHLHEQGSAGAPVIRKLGRHHSRVVKAAGAPAFSPSRAPGSEEKKHSTKEMVSSSDQTAVIEPKKEENRIVEGEKVLAEKQHHSMDKSIAGGGVILGGLATTFLVAVFCYIRATGRKNSETTAELT